MKLIRIQAVISTKVNRDSTRREFVSKAGFKKIRPITASTNGTFRQGFD